MINGINTLNWRIITNFEGQNMSDSVTTGAPVLTGASVSGRSFCFWLCRSFWSCRSGKNPLRSISVFTVQPISGLSEVSSIGAQSKWSSMAKPLSCLLKWSTIVVVASIDGIVNKARLIGWKFNALFSKSPLAAELLISPPRKDPDELKHPIPSRTAVFFVCGGWSRGPPR